MQDYRKEKGADGVERSAIPLHHEVAGTRASGASAQHCLGGKLDPLRIVPATQIRTVEAELVAEVPVAESARRAAFVFGVAPSAVFPRPRTAITAADATEAIRVHVSFSYARALQNTTLKIWAG